MRATEYETTANTRRGDAGPPPLREGLRVAKYETSAKARRVPAASSGAREKSEGDEARAALLVFTCNLLRADEKKKDEAAADSEPAGARERSASAVRKQSQGSGPGPAFGTFVAAARAIVTASKENGRKAPASCAREEGRELGAPGENNERPQGQQPRRPAPLPTMCGKVVEATRLGPPFSFWQHARADEKKKRKPWRASRWKSAREQRGERPPCGNKAEGAGRGRPRARSWPSRPQ